MGRHLSAPWDELQMKRDTCMGRSFRLVFRAGTSRYFSEWYTLRRGEDAVRMARALCVRNRWDKRNPAADTKG